VRVRVGYGGQGHMSAMAISGGEQVSADGGGEQMSYMRSVSSAAARAGAGWRQPRYVSARPVCHSSASERVARTLAATCRTTVCTCALSCSSTAV